METEAKTSLLLGVVVEGAAIWSKASSSRRANTMVSVSQPRVIKTLQFSLNVQKNAECIGDSVQVHPYLVIAINIESSLYVHTLAQSHFIQV